MWLSDLCYHLLLCFVSKTLMSLSVMIERCHIYTGLWPCLGDPATFILLVLKLFHTYCKVHWCIVLLKPHTLSDIWWHTIQRFRCMVLKEVVTSLQLSGVQTWMFQKVCWSWGHTTCLHKIFVEIESGLFHLDSSRPKNGSIYVWVAMGI